MAFAFAPVAQLYEGFKEQVALPRRPSRIRLDAELVVPASLSEWQASALTSTLWSMRQLAGQQLGLAAPERAAHLRLFVLG